MEGFDRHLAALRAERERLERESGLSPFVPREYEEEGMRSAAPRPTMPPPPPLPSAHHTDSEILSSLAKLKEEHAKQVRQITEMALANAGSGRDATGGHGFAVMTDASGTASLGAEDMSPFSDPAVAAALAGSRMAMDLTSLTQSFGATSTPAPAPAPATTAGWTASYRPGYAPSTSASAGVASGLPTRPSFDRPLLPAAEAPITSASGRATEAPTSTDVPPQHFGERAHTAPSSRIRGSPARAPARPRAGEPTPTSADFEHIGPVVPLAPPPLLPEPSPTRPSTARLPSAPISTRHERSRSASVGRIRPPASARSPMSVRAERHLRASADAAVGKRPSSARASLGRSGSAPSLRRVPKKDPPPFGYSKGGIALHMQPRAETLHDAVEPRTYVARPIPEAVKARKWEEMQEMERERKARIKAEAKRLVARARLPPRMEERAKEDALRASVEAEKRAAAEEAEAVRQAASVLKAKPIPADVRMPKWEAMQLEEAGRAERIHAEAEKLRARSRLPPRMQREADSQERERRRQAHLDKIRAEAYKDLTFTPLVRPLPSHSQPFKPAPRPFSPPPSKPFDLLTDAIKDPEGKGSIPSNAEKERVLRDIARDELVLPERRWPYVSRRAPVRSTPPPPVQPVPPPPTTTSTELRKAALEMERLKKQIEEERKRQVEERRLQDAAVASKKVARALDLPSAREKERRERQEQAERARAFRRELAQKDADHQANLNEMYARVAQRHFLFQQQGIDQKVYEETQAAYERFESALKKQGISELLDVH